MNQETCFAEVCIQHDLKSSGDSYWYLMPSSKLGLIAKCGSMINNPPEDPVWERIKQYATTSPNPATTRVVVEIIGPELFAYSPTTVINLMPISN